jgi:hypothetical protein
LSKELSIHHGLIGKFFGLLPRQHRLKAIVVGDLLVILTWIERRHL